MLFFVDFHFLFSTFAHSFRYTGIKKQDCAMKIKIINYRNINLLGKREPSIYGSVTFEDYLADLRKRYVDVEIDYFQSNIEGENDRLHTAGGI